jgi:hypothetical protein
LKISELINANFPRLDTLIQYIQKVKENLNKNLKHCQPLMQQLQLAAQKIALMIKHFLIKNTHFYISDTIFLNQLEYTHRNTTDTNTLLNYIEEFYTKDNYKEIIRLFDEWTAFDCIKDRQPILRSCRAIILSNLPEQDIANVVIPNLLAQIDGTVKDFYINLNSDLKDKKFIKHHKVLTDNDMWSECSYRNYFDIISIIHYLFYFDNGIVNGKDNKGNKKHILEKGTEKELENYVLNRNEILHGSILDYGKKVELIRTVLLYDTILKTITNTLNEIKPLKKVAKSGSSGDAEAKGLK